MMPTDAGRIFYRYAQAVLDQLDHAKLAFHSKILPPDALAAVSISFSSTSVSVFGVDLLSPRSGPGRAAAMTEI
jgi:DNA-binding transcriptional LysR family regulator